MDTLTLEEIKNKYLFNFCNPGNGKVLTCGFEKEENIAYDSWKLHFLSCTEDPEGWDFVDNVFVSYDKENWKPNWYESDAVVIYDDIEDEYIQNFIRRLFSFKKEGLDRRDRFIERVLDGVQ